MFDDAIPEEASRLAPEAPRETVLLEQVDCLALPEQLDNNPQVLCGICARAPGLLKLDNAILPRGHK